MNENIESIINFVNANNKWILKKTISAGNFRFTIFFLSIVIKKLPRISAI